MTLAMRSPLSCVVMTAPSGCGGDEGAEDGAVARADGELRVPLHAEAVAVAGRLDRSEEHTSELQSLMRISYDVFCLQKNIVHCVHPALFKCLRADFHRHRTLAGH